MYPDFKELLSVLNEHQAKYLVVGAYALSIHAQPRATKDLDIWIKPDAENAKAVFTALAKFGAPLEGLTPGDFAEPGPFFRMGHAPVGIDLLTKIDGVDFDIAWEKRVQEIIDTASGLKINFISRDDFIATKTASGRPQDVADVAAVREADKQRALGEIANGLETSGGNGQKNKEQDRDR
jgi:hypothetical protein